MTDPDVKPERWRKKPVVIEAMRLPGDEGPGDRAVADWCGGALSGGACFIGTLEGEMEAQRGDWIIKGVAGEFYPCKSDIFAATYEETDRD